MRIDSWELGSQYPNGHFVRSLGQIGDLETEIQAILLENELSVLPFSEGQVSLMHSISNGLINNGISFIVIHEHIFTVLCALG